MLEENTDANVTKLKDAHGSVVGREHEVGTPLPVPPGAGGRGGASDSAGPGVDAVRREFVQKTNAYITEYIKFGDAKAGALLTLVALLGGTLGYAAKETLPQVSVLCNFSAVCFALVGLASVVGLAFAGWQCLTSLSPRVSPAQGSLNSFPDIAKMTANEYADGVDSLSGSQACREIAVHNNALSKVALAKFDFIGRATFWIRVAAVSTVAFLVLHIVLVSLGAGLCR